MPWSIKDVDRFNKGLSEKDKHQWVRVANKALRGGDDKGTAVRKANGVVSKRGK